MSESTLAGHGALGSVTDRILPVQEAQADQ